ncbi:hypothetical protein [Burkholderia gladioli]|uniref:hypothetical protein n=1 Tax=Burkholderia gladioli TaxID=28095 RepID=UPI00163E7D27|nr:hypothetical protein [Burkholderia gladioli]
MSDALMWIRPVALVDAFDFSPVCHFGLLVDSDAPSLDIFREKSNFENCRLDIVNPAESYPQVKNRPEKGAKGSTKGATIAPHAIGGFAAVTETFR